MLKNGVALIVNFTKIALLCLVSFLFININAQDKSPNYLEFGCRMDTATFHKAEKLSYKAYFNVGFIWIGVGETHFSMEETTLDDKPVYHSFANAFNYKKTAWIYEVKDTYQTYLDKYTLLPVRFERDVHEGNYSMDYQYDFDWQRKQLYIDHMTKQNKIRREDEWVDIAECTYDVMSAYHYARNLDYSDLEVGESLPFNLFLDGKTFKIQVKYLGKETIKTKLGKFRCIKFSPELIEGNVFADGDELVVYVSDDENKVPIYMESKLSVGKVKVYLQDYELSYPLDSQVK